MARKKERQKEKERKKEKKKERKKERKEKKKKNAFTRAMKISKAIAMNTMGNAKILQNLQNVCLKSVLSQLGEKKFFKPSECMFDMDQYFFH